MLPPLRESQVSAVSFLLRHPFSALFADPGTGKTRIILTLLRHLYLLKPNAKTLIVAPKRVCQYVWPAEIEKWGFRFSAQFLRPGKKASTPADINLVNPEGLSRIHGKAYDILIIDESSKFKNPSAKRLKQIRPLLPEFQRRHILTGTPTPQGLMDLWSQLYLVDTGECLGNRITHYRTRFFYPVSRGNYNDWVLRRESEHEIRRLIAPKTFRIEAADLPALIENEITVPLPPAIQVSYKDMARKLHTLLGSEDILAPNAASAYRACRQITSGAIYREDKSVMQLHSAKIDALADLIGELQYKSVLIGYCFTHEGDRLSARFPGLARIDGRTTEKETTEILRRWNAGELQLLAAQAQTISHGLNLQSGGCQDVCWFSLTDDFDAQDQFVRRVYRSGVAGSVRVHYLLAPGTVDEKILARSRDKDARQRSMLDYLKRNNCVAYDKDVIG